MAGRAHPPRAPGAAGAAAAPRAGRGRPGGRRPGRAGAGRGDGRRAARRRRGRRDYEGFPTILVVTTARAVAREAAAEARVVAAVRRAEAARTAGHAAPLPVLVTTLGRLRADLAGVRGAIWCAPAAPRDRRHW